LFRTFMRFRNRVRNRSALEIVLGKLEFLTNQFEIGMDKIVDAYYWREQLDALESLNDDSLGIRHAYQAYKTIFKLFLEKNQLSEQLTLDELLALMEQKRKTEKVE
jgi:hypothetical protein